MSYSELGNIEFFILFLIFTTYLVYLLMSKGKGENEAYANAPVVQEEDISGAIMKKVNILESSVQVLQEASGSAMKKVNDIGSSTSSKMQALEDTAMKKVNDLVSQNQRIFAKINVLQEVDSEFASSLYIVQEEQQGLATSFTSMFSKIGLLVRDLQKFPGEMKKRFASELDRLIRNVTPQTPSGDFVNFVSIDASYFNPPKVADDPNQKMFYTEEKHIEYNPEEMQKVAIEYMLIDKVFRDLYYVDEKRYNSIFYKDFAK